VHRGFRVTTVVLIGRVVLAAVFAVAGAAKLADLEGSRSAARGSDVPERLVRPVAVPVAEVAIAALLVFPAPAVPWVAAAALLVLTGTFVRLVRAMWGVAMLGPENC
jgi:uncharacterized membrane protein YphA (DoxX/SURF4 family)